ncbi:hypothetical protein [Streptomyces yaizuensis]|uniref:Uncharacterized protein n=1 Tax=Streptomyces yaizuensis TaxID=2989713 RepID=A0ABQ5P6R2_9ACTN|nr:hypothetical protein [Streptomyces sp. YSPA8]GLF98244.1 hypothetical protein SYYSPA8_28125 [Streptomyces sp. YSPA8]
MSALLDEVPPRNPLARRPVEAFARLDRARLGVFMIGDLEHAAGSWPGSLPRTLPVMPWQAVTLVDGSPLL